jgi:hypothetical protein
MTADSKRKITWIHGVIDRAQITLHSRHGKPVTAMHIQRYKKPLRFEAQRLTKNPNKHYILQLGHNPQLQLWVWKNDPDKNIWIGLGDQYRKLESHDIETLLAIMIRLSLAEIGVFWAQNGPTKLYLRKSLREKVAKIAPRIKAVFFAENKNKRPHSTAVARPGRENNV